MFKRILHRPFSWMFIALLIFVAVPELMMMIHSAPIDSPFRYRFLAMCVILYVMIDCFKLAFRKDELDLESKRVIKFGDLKDMESRVKPEMKVPDEKGD